MATYVLLAHAAFLQCNDVAKLLCGDIKFLADSMAVHMQSSKTDQYQQGDITLVARTGSSTMMESYFEMSSLSQSSTLSLFSGITQTKQGQHLGNIEMA